MTKCKYCGKEVTDYTEVKYKLCQDCFQAGKHIPATLPHNNGSGQQNVPMSNLTNKEN